MRYVLAFLILTVLAKGVLEICGTTPVTVAFIVFMAAVTLALLVKKEDKDVSDQN